MKRWLLLLLWSSSITGLKQEYKTLQAYGDTLYNLISEFVQTNSTNSSSDVSTYITSDATKTVFSDGNIAGYSKSRILFSCYQTSLSVSAPVEAIVDGIHTVLQKDAMVEQVQYYGSFTNMGMTSVMVIYIIQHAWRYFKYDKRLLDSMRGTGATIGTYRPIPNTNGPFAPSNS